MNYEKMIAVNRIESEQKIKLATMAIEQLIERGEYGGHKNPDTESICSAIAYAALKTKLTGHAYEPRRAGQ